MTLRQLVTISLIGILVLASGCVSTNQSKVFPTPSPDKGLVYFYLKGGILETTALYSVEQDNQFIGSLEENAYLFVFSEPGNHIFTSNSESESAITINVEAGKTYYVKCDIKKGLFAGHPRFKLADERKANEVIQYLKDVTK